MTLEQIVKKTEAFSKARHELAEQVRWLEEGIADMKKIHLPKIKKAVAAAKQKQVELADAISEAPELFVKPRKIVIGDITIGYQKGKGEISINKKDWPAICARIKKFFPDAWDVYIQTTEKPLTSTLQQLSAHELKKLGLEITGTGDKVLIKANDSDVDKLVSALLKDEAEEVAA
ncbi:MAG: hypothetical protein WC291_00940 [Thermodesulfovibrionales bacterium]|jgi:hypothetical protein